MATFLNIVDVTFFAFSLVGLVIAALVVAYIGGTKGWSIREMFATWCGAFTFDVPGWKKSHLVILCVGSLLFSWYFDLTWCLWLQVIVQSFALFVHSKIGQYRQALI